MRNTCVVGMVALVLGCGDNIRPGNDDARRFGDGSSADDAITDDASTDAMPPGPLASDPCAIYRADQDTDNQAELYLSCVDGTTVTRTKLNSSMIAGGDVQSTFRAAGGTISYIADAETDGVFELYVVRVTATTVTPATKANHTLVATESVSSQYLSEDGTKLVYLVVDPTATGGRLYYLDLETPNATPVRIDTLASLPVLAGGVYGGDFVDDTFFFNGASVIQGGRREWFRVIFTGQTAGDPQRIHPAYTSFESALSLVAPNPRWALYAARQDTFELDAYLVDLRAATPAAPAKASPALVAGGGVSDLAFAFTAPDTGVFTFLADATTAGKTELYAFTLTNGVAGTTSKLNQTLAATGDVQQGRATPDGARVVYLADPAANGRVELFSVDISGSTPGTPTPASDSLTVDLDAFEFVSNSLVAYRTEGAMTTGICSIYVKDLASSAPPVLVTDTGLGTAFGTLLAVPQTGRLYVTTRTGAAIDLESVDLGTQPPTLTKINPPLAAGGVRNVTPSEDGKALFYRASQDSAAITDLYRVDVSGASPATPVKLTGTFVANGQLFGHLPYSRP